MDDRVEPHGGGHPMIAGACVLVVDDDKAVRNALKINLSKNGLEVLLATTAKEALQMLHRHPVELMLTDVQMPGITGLQLLEQVRSTWPHIAVVVMTGYGSVRDAVDVMKTGASDYIIKPIQKDELLLIIERALESKALKAELVKLRREVVDRYGFENIIGTNFLGTIKCFEMNFINLTMAKNP